MEPKKKKQISSFFDMTTAGRARCLIVDCRTHLHSQKCSALIRHFEQVHASKLKEVFFPKNKNLGWLRLSTIYACVKHVTTCGRPLTSIYDDSFQEFLRERLEKLSGTPFALTMNIPHLRNFVKESAVNLRQRIIEETKDRFVSLMLDIATRQNRCILGVSLQTVKKGEVIVRTISMERIRARHTARNLKEMVLNILEKYLIKPENVLSATTDNGTNMLLLANELNAFVMENILDGSDILDSEDENEEDPLEDDPLLDPEIQMDLLNRAAEELNSTFRVARLNAEFTTSVRCGSHTFQLGVNDGLKNSNCTPVISKARKLAKELRKSSFRLLLEDADLCIPRLDTETRWFATYMMVKKLYLFKNCRRILKTHLLISIVGIDSQM